MYCPECGLQQSEAHTYCERCGALLHVEAKSGETTGPFALGDHDSDVGVAGGIVVEGPALALRSGGGISGEIYPLSGDRVTIGRDPESHIFLDDVTVSRNHAVIEMGPDGPALKDLGSLNGTYVNRRRIESVELIADGDELQIGKFRLAFVSG